MYYVDKPLQSNLIQLGWAIVVGCQSKWTRRWNGE